MELFVLSKTMVVLVSEEVRVYTYRWAVLLVFGFVFMIGQMMWLVFSLIRNEVTPVLGLAAGDPGVVLLTASQPLAFIILSMLRRSLHCKHSLTTR